MNTLRRALLVWIVPLFCLVGCSKSPEKAAPPRSNTSHPLASPAISTCNPGQPGGRLNLVCVGVPQTLNPVLVRDGASDAIVRLLSAGLVSVDMTTEEARPALAES